MPASTSIKSPFDSSVGPQLKKIVFLGWGSLVWDQQDLKIRGEWELNGPKLKIEFLRRSCRKNPTQEYLSLVLDENGTEVQSLWAIADHDTLNSAKSDLWARETPTAKPGKAIHSWQKGQQAPDLIFKLEKWAQDNGVDAVVWAGLECKWPKNGQAPSKEEAVAWLRELKEVGKSEFAEQYARKTHPQIDTVYRRAITSELGWVPPAVKSKDRGKGGSLLIAIACAALLTILVISLVRNRTAPEDELSAPTPVPLGFLAQTSDTLRLLLLLGGPWLCVGATAGALEMDHLSLPTASLDSWLSSIAGG